MASQERSFRDYKAEAEVWITLATGEFYPDILPEALRLYEPVLVEFGRLLKVSHSSAFLFASIMETPSQWMRTQLPGRVKVVTLRMVPDRITAEWLRS